MNDKELLEYMRKVDKNFNTHLENETIEMSLEYYNLCEELMTRGINAIQENEQLKKQLEQKEDIINKSKEHLELKVIRYSNETDYMLDETDLKEIIEILDNKGE